MMNRVKGKKRKQGYCLVTGASSGIGEVFARQLAEEGFPLILAARRVEKLQKLQQELENKYPSLPVEIRETDLTDETDLQSLESYLKEKRILMVINNAGCGKVGKFTDISEEDAAYMDRLNITAMRRITEISLRIFTGQQEGWLLNVASSAGLLPAGPFMTQYYAGKAYVASLTRGIAEELRQEKNPVYIGCLCPGPVNTEFNCKAGVTSPLRGISPEACVRYSIKQMKRRKIIIVPAFYMRLALLGGRLIPESLMIRLTGNQQKKKLRK